MIRIYDKEELEFLSLGLGSLDESKAAIVSEELNGSYELELEYPITGRHFDKIQFRNIVYCKPNMYSAEEPFRIYSISKPIKGIITVNAAHISYDASGIVIKPKRNEETKEIISFGVFDEPSDGYLLSSVLAGINASSPLLNRFEIIKDSDKEDVIKKDGYSISSPMSLRSILGGTNGSILDQYKGEYLFNKFKIYLKNKRGTDRGITIRYGKNMTDLEHESEGSKLYTGIFPFYSKNYTETSTSTSPIFQPAYVIPGVTPLRADWLSVEFVDPGTIDRLITPKVLDPVVETVEFFIDEIGTLATHYVAIIVKTVGSTYENKTYIFRKKTLIEAYALKDQNGEIILNESGNITGLVDGVGNTIAPVFGNIYVIKDSGTGFYNKNIIYDNGNILDPQYVVYDSEGFYEEVIDARTVENEHPFTQYTFPLTSVIVLPTTKISWSEVEGQWVDDPINGNIYVYPMRPNVSSVTIEKSVYLDLENCEKLIEESSAIIFDKNTGIMYGNQGLKDRPVQNILSLDLTSDIDNIENIEQSNVTQEVLFDKAEQYLKDNNLEEIKETITVSFVQLSNSPEYQQFKNLEVVELGDEVTVIYEGLGINTKRRVIYTEYDVLSNSYSEIELGDKAGVITNSIVSSGDNISSLKNDANYADREYVTELIAENAKIIYAEIQKAFIRTLQVEKINISNSLEASSASIDQLVARMLSADNAAIANALIAGTVRVRGDLSMDSGSIKINKQQEAVAPVSMYIVESGKYLESDWLTDLVISKWMHVGFSETEIFGDINIEVNYVLGQSEEALMFIDSEYPSSNYSYGVVLVLKDMNGVYHSFECQPGPINPSSYPEGTIFKVLTNGDYKDKKYKWNPTLERYKLVSTYVFAVDRDGNVEANSLIITGGEIEIGDNFNVSNEGILTAKGVRVIDGRISIKDKFDVDEYGNVTAKAITIDEAYADKIKATELVADRIYLLGDKRVWFERVTENNTQSESQTVIASASALGLQESGILHVSVYVTTNLALYYEKTFIVGGSYRDLNNNVYSFELPVVVAANGTSGGSIGDILVSALNDYTVDFQAVPFPKRYTESRITGVSTNKIILRIDDQSYDIVTGGVVDNPISFVAQQQEPDTTHLRDQSLWFDIDD